jgi:phage-related protein
MRLSGRSGIARAVYVTAVGKRVVVVHIFVKKTQKKRLSERLKSPCGEPRRLSDAEVYSRGRGI